jgi:glycine dehydrogenase subunit 1
LTCHANTTLLIAKLTTITGVSRLFNGPYFHETVLRLTQPVKEILRTLATQNILGGYSLAEFYPELGDCLLVCATEMRTDLEMDNYAKQLQKIMNN